MANRDVEPTASGGYSAKSSVFSVHRVTLSTSGSSGAASGAAERLHPAATMAMSKVENRDFRATMCLPLRVPKRFVPDGHRVANRCCESVLVRRYEPRRAAQECRPHPRDTRLRRSAPAPPRSPAALRESAACRSASTSEAPVISLRMRYSMNKRSASTRDRSASHLAASRPPSSNRGSATVTPNTPPVLRPDNSSARLTPPNRFGEGSRDRRAASASNVAR